MDKLDTPWKSINPSSRFTVFFMKRSFNVSYFRGAIIQTLIPMKKYAYIGLGIDVVTKSCVQRQCYGRTGDLKGTSPKSEPQHNDAFAYLEGGT